MAIDPTYQNRREYNDESVDSVTSKLGHRGFALIRRDTHREPTELMESLGEVVDTTDVEVDEASSGMVTSHRELDVHTDHGGIDYIVWVCHSQADSGGESLLVDGYEVLEELSASTREALEQVYLTEHRVFPGDPARRPLLRYSDGDPRLFYSSWLLDDDLTEKTKTAYDVFRDAVSNATVTKLKLQPGDVLVVDNTRVLHGRTAIEEDSDRCLKRYWIKSDRRNVPCEPSSETKRRHALPDNTDLELPDPITEHRVEELKRRGVEPAIAEIDLSMVKMKLRDQDEGKGWTIEECETAELEYKRYLTLNFRYEDRAIVPTKQIDDFWHYHILDTRAYHRDCQRVFGEYFHHFPYFGMRGDEDEENLKNSFFETVDLYEREFGESMLRYESQSTDCWNDCKGRCWHACSD